MAATAIADIIVPEVFAPYMVEAATEKSEIIRAGIAQRSAEFDAKASSEGVTVEMPFWDDLTGDSEVVSDSGSLTVNAITADKDIASTNFRGKAWGANDVVGWVSGDDPMRRIGDLTGGFWARDMQRIMIQILAGLFNSSTGVLKTTHRLDIYSDVAAGAISDSNRLTGSTFIDGLQKLGDANQQIVAVAMHSDTEAFLRQRDLIDFIPDSEGKSQIKIFQGRRVIIDDNCPKAAAITTLAIRKTQDRVPPDILLPFNNENCCVLVCQSTNFPGGGAKDRLTFAALIEKWSLRGLFTGTIHFARPDRTRSLMFAPFRIHGSSWRQPDRITARRLAHLFLLIGRPGRRRNGARDRTLPGHFGARASKLLPLLKKGHYCVKLSENDFHCLTLWLDYSSLFYGVYEKEGGEAQLHEIARPTLE